MVSCHDIEEEGFSLFGRYEDWGQRKGRFEALQSLLSFLSPDDGIHLFEELVERHPSFVELGDEAAQGSQTAGEPLYTLDIAYGAHVGNGRDLFRVGLDVAFRHDVSEQLPLRNPKNTFLEIQFDVEPSEVHERRGQVCDQVTSLSRFDQCHPHRRRLLVLAARLDQADRVGRFDR